MTAIDAMTDFSGKVAVVTGAASGIGRALADRRANIVVDGGLLQSGHFDEARLSSDWFGPACRRGLGGSDT